MPVSLMGEEGLGEGENEGRLVDLLGQTIVLIQVHRNICTVYALRFILRRALFKFLPKFQ